MIKKLLYGIIIGVLIILCIYEFCTFNILSGILMCVVILFFIPSFRNRGLYKKLPRFVKIILPVLLFFTSILTTSTSLTTEQIIQNELNEVMVISGDKKVDYKGLVFDVNKNLRNENDIYYLDDSQSYPCIQINIFDEEIDFQNYDKLQLEKEIQDFIKNKELTNDISDFSFEKCELDSKECFKTSYFINVKEKTKKLLSEKIKVKGIHIPTSSGMYNIMFDTYKEDKNDYQFEQWINTIKLGNLYSYTDGLKQKREEEQEKQKALESLKSEVKNIKCHSNANEQEKQIFDTRKQNILTLIENKSSVEEISNAKSLLEQTNTDIQARIDREEEKIAAQQAAEQQAANERAAQSSSSNNSSYSQGNTESTIRGGYYCVDGTYVGNADPHARGRANKCYGHGGFEVNH